jgi:arsenate reductase
MGLHAHVGRTARAVSAAQRGGPADFAAHPIGETGVKRKVLFLCTGNSARSQMAEAIVNSELGDDWEAFSAGTAPAGYVHPSARRVLSEIGIDHHGRSKSVDEFRDVAFDLVVTVCDDAAENCPVWLGQGSRTHLGFPDPAKAVGTDEEVMTVFRATRDSMRDHIVDRLTAYNTKT